MGLREFVFQARSKRLAVLLVVAAMGAQVARAQGVSPETAPPLFPGGWLISYNSVITTRGPATTSLGSPPATARPTFAHEGDFNFTWGFRPNFDLTLIVPIITNHFAVGGEPLRGGTGLGDTLVLVKYRFYRRDSERGTTQGSVTVGPKLPTGRTDLRDVDERLLPAGLQPGSGSVDLFLGANWTYTGLFHLKRLVADEDFHTLLRSQGTEATRLGGDVKSRFWLSYRPYQSKTVGREWFIGPALTWLGSGEDRIGGAVRHGSAGDELLAGAASYIGLRPGLHVWLGVDWAVAHTSGAAFMPARRHISFGLTQQFQF